MGAEMALREVGGVTLDEALDYWSSSRSFGRQRRHAQQAAAAVAPVDLAPSLRAVRRSSLEPRPCRREPPHRREQGAALTPIRRGWQSDPDRYGGRRRRGWLSFGGSGCARYPGRGSA
jgi:hypothetical protein